MAVQKEILELTEDQAVALDDYIAKQSASSGLTKRVSVANLLKDAYNTGERLALDPNIANNNRGLSYPIASPSATYITDVIKARTITGTSAVTVSNEVTGSDQKKIELTLTDSRIIIEEDHDGAEEGAGNTIGFFICVSSVSGPVNGISSRIVRSYGSGGSSSTDQIGVAKAINAGSDHTWYRLSDITLASLDGKTIGSGAETRFAFDIAQNAGVKDLVIHAHRFQDKVDQIPADTIPEWIKADEPKQVTTRNVRRYAQKWGGGNTFTRIGLGAAESATNIWIELDIDYMVKAPSIITSGNFRVSNQLGAELAVSAIAIDPIRTNNKILTLDVTVVGATAGAIYHLEANNDTTANILVDATY